MKLQESWMLQPDLTINIMLNMRLHKIEAMDNLLFVDIPTIEGTFYQISSMLKRPYHSDKFPGELFRCSLFL